MILFLPKMENRVVKTAILSFRNPKEQFQVPEL